MYTLLITLLLLLLALVLVARFCASRFSVFPLYNNDDEEIWWETDNPNEDQDYDEGA